MTVRYLQKGHTMDSFHGYIGTYTHRDGKRSKGIYYFDLHPKSGQISIRGWNSQAENPTYLTFSPDHRYLYACGSNVPYNRFQGGGGFSFAVQKDHTLRYLDRHTSCSKTPCHLVCDSRNQVVISASYTEGQVEVHKLGEGGRFLPDKPQILIHQGTGPVSDRQEHAHAHCVAFTPDEERVLVTDLGADRIFLYRFDRETLSLSPDGNVALCPGAGPRHMVFSRDGRFLYLVTELSNQVYVYQYHYRREGAAALEQLQILSTLPEGCEQPSNCAAIRLSPDGKLLFVSNRFTDTVAVFLCDTQTGRLGSPAVFPLAGRNPRDIQLSPDGSLLLAGFQDSDGIQVFQVDPSSAALLPTKQECLLSMPVCFLFE